MAARDTGASVESPGLDAVRRLSLGFGRKLPMILQSESTECGLACLAMVSSYHGARVDLATLRRSYPVSQKGVTLSTLMDIATRMELSARPVRIEVSQLKDLRLPSIIHWEMRHFVVLRGVRKTRVIIHDPAVGERSVSIQEFSRCFSGVALELWPGQNFSKHAPPKPVKLLSLLGNVKGIGPALGQILAIAFVLQVLGLVSPLFMQWVIDRALGSGDQDLLTTLAIGFALLVVVTQGMEALSTWTSLHLSTTWSVQWSTNIFTHLLKLPLAYFEKRHLGDIVSRFQSSATIQTTLTAAFLRSVVDGVMVLFVVGLIFMYSPMLSMITVGAVAAYAGYRILLYRPLRFATQEQIVQAARQNSHFLETVRGARSIKLFRSQDNRRSSWLALLVEQVNSGVKVQKLQMYFALGNGLTFGLVGILIVWLAARLVLRGEFTVGMMMAYLAYQGQFSGRITSLIDRYFEIQMLQVHGERLADILHTEPELETAGGRSVATDVEDLIPRIEVRGLRFRYSEHDPYVLDGVDLVIEPGESIAISGPSGCGKSTLIHLLLGVIAPSEGEVTYGGVSLKSLDLDVLRGCIASVTQNDSLFAGSIADNISFFDERPDAKWIEECARLASIHDEVAAMPMGYNTSIGYLGSVLSGGQQQRVMLARALYRRPKILIMDEATSHLDIRRETMVNAAIRSLHITRIFVAHRPQTIEHADRVVIVDRGRIASERLIAPPMAVVPRTTSTLA